MVVMVCTVVVEIIHRAGGDTVAVLAKNLIKEIAAADTKSANLHILSKLYFDIEVARGHQPQQHRPPNHFMISQA